MSAMSSRDFGMDSRSIATPRSEKAFILNSPNQKPKRKSKLTWFLVLFVLLVVAGVVVGVVFGVVKKNNKTTIPNASNPQSNGSGSGGSTVPGASPSAGSTGTNILYNNPFGGNYTAQPFDDSAAPQSFTPPLNQPFPYGTMPVRGVNIGGWLVLEPFITPDLFQPYGGKVVDEWTLCETLGIQNATAVLTQHYDTFITEQDFADIASAGLNHVRIGFGYWALGNFAQEPYVPYVSWNYLLKGIGWARKYGLRVLLDFHAVPGSQNGWNHSGRQGVIGFLNGTDGIINAERTLNYMRDFATFFSDPSYSNVVTILGIINEPEYGDLGEDVLRNFYTQAYNTVRSATGINTGREPYIAIHDGFRAMSIWQDFLRGADKLALDDHPYIVFGGTQLTPYSQHALVPCTQWGPAMDTSNANFGLGFAGEMSAAETDCALYLNGVGNPAKYEGGCATCTCQGVNEWWTWTDAYKKEVSAWTQVQMDALYNFFFWTWKTGNDTTTGYASAPHWNYQLGLQQGWIPNDPRVAIGACSSVAAAMGTPLATPLAMPTLAASFTGGAGGGTIVGNTFTDWPPSISNDDGGASATVVGVFTTSISGALPTMTAANLVYTTTSIGAAGAGAGAAATSVPDAGAATALTSAGTAAAAAAPSGAKRRRMHG